MNNDNFLIEEFDLDIAKNVCKFIKDNTLRSQSVANVTAANLAKKYFQDCEVDIESGLHNTFQILEDINISDIYIKNNYIDVRLYFNDNELFIPKIPFDLGILPVAYMFIKINEELSNGIVTGFILPSSVDTTKEVNGFYRVEESDLISFYDVDSNIIDKFDDNLPDNIDSLIFDYLDDKLSDKIDFYKLLVDSKEARVKLQNAAKAKIVFDFISVPSRETTTEEGPVEELAEIEEFDSMDLLEESSETIESFDALEEIESDLSLNDSPIEEFNEIEELETLDLEASNDLPFEESDDISLDMSDDIAEPFNLEAPEEEKSEETGSTEEDEEEVPASLNIDINTDSIKMLDAGDYKEQPISDFASNDFQESSLDNEKDSDITIGIVDSSKLTFEEEPPALEFDITTDIEKSEDIAEETPELIITEETIEEDNDTVTILDIPSEADTEENQNTVTDADNNDNHFKFSTNVTPSLDTIEEEEEVEEEVEESSDFSEDLLSSLDSEEDSEAVKTSDEITEPDSTEEIDTLFNPEEEPQEVITDVKPKSKNLLVPIIALVAILGIVSYYSYNKFMVQQTSVNDNIVDNAQNATQPVEPTESTSPIEDAMPVETVENIKVELNTNEGNTVSIPAIEQNLDASITVSNLRVEFEIPAGYKTSKTAERYFTKMGKIVQLNLKTELLLLTKQPITNKIAVELEYNKNSQKFDVKGLVSSSGEPTIDDLILRTVKNAMNINLNMNMSIFETVPGNPVLVIKL